MRKLVLYIKNGKIELVDVPSYVFRPGFVLVKTAYSAISRGTELALVGLLKSSLIQKARKRPQDVKKVIQMAKRYGIKTTYSLVKDRLDAYMPLGYSLSGEVIVADEESEFSKGDRVACGGSEYASHQEIALVPVNMCAKVPEGVSLEEASFTTIGAVSIWALREADIKFGERGLVVGLGLLGILSSLIMKASGIITRGVDIDRKKIDFASKVGISASLLEGLDEEDFDFAIVAASSQSAAPLQYALQKVRRRGRVVIIGSVPIEADRNILYEKEVKISVSKSYGPGRYDPYYEILGYRCPLEYQRWNVKENMKTFLSLIALNGLNVKDVITHRFKFDDAPKVYDMLKHEHAVGVVLEYPEKVKPFNKIETGKTNKVVGKIHVGVIGAGTFVKNFILPHFKSHKDVVLDTVCNEKPETSLNVAERFGFLSYTNDPSDLIKRGLDLIVIGTRHDTHGRLVKDALLSGRPVYVEKPLSINLEDIYDIEKIIKEKGGFLHVGFNRRFSKGLSKVREFIKDQEPLTGFIRVIAGKLPKNHWAKIREIGGDRIVGEVCHFIDAAVYLTQSPVMSVFAKSVKVHSDFDDNLHIVLRMENGSLITILYTEWGSGALGKEYYEIHQLENSIMLYDFREVVLKGKKNVKLKANGKGHKEEVKAVINGLLEGKPPIPLSDILNVSLSTFAIRKSLREGREVFISEF